MANKGIEFSLELRTSVNSRRTTFRDAFKGLEALSAGAIDFNRMDPIIKKWFRNFLTSIAEAQGTRHGKPWPGGTGSTTLSRRSGNLMASVRKSVRVSGNFTDQGGEIRGRIGSPLIYARAQEFGATIVAKNSPKKWLTIPLPAALDARGIMKLPKARDYPRTFVARSRRGNLIIFQKKGAKKIIPLFVLKKRVKLPPRMNLGTMIEAGSLAVGQRIIQDAQQQFARGKI